MPAQQRLSVAVQIVAGIVFGLLAAEGTTRLVCAGGNWTPNSPFSSNGLGPAPGESFRLRPNLRTNLQLAWQPKTAIIADERGWRVPRADYPRPPVGESVLFVGASFTFGFGVEAEESYPFVAEHLLAESPRPIRVHNASLMSHTLPQMLAVLENLPPGVEPDRVFICLPLGGLYILGLGSTAEAVSFVDNDGGLSNLTLAGGGLHLELEDVGGWLMRIDRRPKTAFTDFVQTRTAVGHRAVRRLTQAFRPQRIVERKDPIDKQLLTKACGAIGERLGRVNRDFAKRGVRVHLVYERIHERLLEMFARRLDEGDMEYFRAFGRASGIATRELEILDLTNPSSPNYVPLDDAYGGDFLVPFDDHYSIRGHRKVGERLAQWLLEKPPRKRG